MNATTAKNYALPPVSGRYGAAMGRHAHGPADPDDPARWYCANIPLDSGGYEYGARVLGPACRRRAPVLRHGWGIVRSVRGCTLACGGAAMVRGGEA